MMVVALALVGLLQQPTFQDTAVIPALRRAEPQVSTFVTVFKRPIDEAHLLLVVQGVRYDGGLGVLGVFLVDAANSSLVWALDIVPSGEVIVEVVRFDATFVLLSLADSDGKVEPWNVKLFFDRQSKRLIRKIEYGPVETRVTRSDDRLCATVEVGAVSRLVCMDGETPRIAGQPPRAAAGTAEEVLAIPQSTYDEFARARPGRVKDGYTREGTTIAEKAVVYQTVGNRMWFGKQFYDGEGSSGVGAIGYFDRTAQRHVLMHPPGIEDWSTSALLVTPDVGWIGLASYGEGAAGGGGLMRYDFASNRSSITKIPHVIRTIHPWNGAMYLGTANGLYIVRGERVAHFSAEPTSSGGVEIVSVTD